MRTLFLLSICLLASHTQAQQIVLKNDKIQRILTFNGKVWRTTKFAIADGSKPLLVKSDEFNILPMEGNSTLSIADFVALAKPRFYKIADTTFLEIKYKPLASALENQACPQSLSIHYFVVTGQYVIRKRITLFYNKPATVDRLEVERFINNDKQSGGGRGEPVFIDNRWFLGLEYPAGYSRRTNGNLPESYARHYDTVGNYSFIDLENRDIEPNAEKGMIRLMHFPGYAVENENQFQINSKTSVAGVAQKNETAAHAFMQYLTSFWKPSRSFLNYNNWFDTSAKDLKGDAFVNIYKIYKNAIAPFGVTLDAMVADDGWQDRQSIWQGSPKYFPNGDDDLVALRQKLKWEGVGLGLWLSLNSYTNNIDWGIKNGYHEAQPNSYFKRYDRYYSLSATTYKQTVLQRIPYLAQKADIIYFKHDFNELCDIGEGNNHPPTDRHGHEANLDAALEILTATRKAKPEIFQNLTNWIWFSPWWLQYADYLWMLAGDDGFNGNTPEISNTAMATTDRDTYLWRLYGDTADRPLVPISRLMTHGIIKTSTDETANQFDGLQEWLDYVLMYYGRGTLLQEWYISAHTMQPDYWKGLCRVNNWAKKHRQELNNTFFVGGRPDEGNAYGYIGWNKDKAVLVARNTNAIAQKLIIPFDASTGFYGVKNVVYRASVVYPYRDSNTATFISGKSIEVTLPGFATMAFEFEKGDVKPSATRAPYKIQFTTTTNASQISTDLTVPNNVQNRCDLLLVGYPEIPVITIDGKTVSPKRSAKALINNFSSYAIAGMLSQKAINWNMTSIDLLPYAGKKIKIKYTQPGKFKSYLLAEQVLVKPEEQTQQMDELWPITNNTRRQTVELY